MVSLGRDTPTKAKSRKYPEELRRRAVRMALTTYPTPSAHRTKAECTNSGTQDSALVLRGPIASECYGTLRD